ncbi:SpoIIE family protein phosphatase [Streptomyces sp. NBC_01619]|nr:SpoIIE family protein phosphatase [Streptomyces sp. NBC_01619]MCX4512191.1 SpoIIE family protein phosphatase [Streptomyces sp. NBC_01619]
MSTPQHSSGPAGPRLDEAVLAALFSQSPIGLHIMDTGLRLVRVNAAARLIRDFPLDRMLGRPLRDVLDAFGVENAQDIESRARIVLETGRPLLDLRFRVRSPRVPAVERMVCAHCFRIQDTDGTVLGLANAITDITTRTRAEGRLKLLNRAGTSIGTSLDVFRTAAELCEVAVPELADSVAVDVLDSVLHGQAPTPGTVPGNLTLRRAGFRSCADKARHGVPKVGEVSAYPVGSPFRDAMSSLRPHLDRHLDADAPWLDPKRDRDARLLAARAHSMMVVPMCARGVVLGLACFYRWRNATPFDEQDLALAQQLAAGTALCLDNARLYSRERSVAGFLQRGRRPSELEMCTAVETAQNSLPAGAGSTWADVIPLSGARVALATGGTAEHGIEAVAATAELRAVITALSDLELPPDELLERLHDLVSRPTRGSRGDPDDRTPRLLTCLYAVYDPATRRCAMARAGHPSPAVVHPGGGVELADVPEGPPLGEGLAQYTVAECALPEGSTLVLYNEAMLPAGPDGARLPLDRVRHAVRSTAPRESLQQTCDAIFDEVAAAHPRQDAFLLLARTRALDADHTASWSLPNTPEVVATARRLTVGQLGRWGLADRADTTALIVSELVTNAVRYADGPIELRLIRDRALTCEVTDDSSTAPHLRRALDSDEGGRGLYITAQLTDRWGIRPGRRGKTIWAEQALPGSAPGRRPES